MAAGDYSKTTYVNGSAPAISASNLNNIEDKVEELDNYAGNDRGVLSLTITTANVTLSAAQALNDVIICSGTLTGNRSVIIPAGIKKPYKIVIKNINKYYIRFITASSGLYFDAYGLTTDEAAIRPSYSFDIATDGTDVYGEGVPPLVRAEYKELAAISAGAIIQYNTKVEDTHSAVTTGASWKFTAPISGVYLVSVHGLTQTTAGDIYMSKNGNTTVGSDNYKHFTRWEVANRTLASASIRLNAGEYVNFRSVQAVVYEAYSWIQITRIGS